MVSLRTNSHHYSKGIQFAQNDTDKGPECIIPLQHHSGSHFRELPWDLLNRFKLQVHIVPICCPKDWVLMLLLASRVTELRLLAIANFLCLLVFSQVVV